MRSLLLFQNRFYKMGKTAQRPFYKMVSITDEGYGKFLTKGIFFFGSFLLDEQKK